MYVYINIGNSGASGHGTCVSFCSSMHSSVLDSGSAWGMLRLEEVRVTSMKRKMKDLRTTMIMTIVMMMMMIMTIMIMMMMMVVVVVMVMMMMMKWGYNVDASFMTNHHYHFYYRIQKKVIYYWCNNHKWGWSHTNLWSININILFCLQIYHLAGKLSLYSSLAPLD